MAGLLLLVFTLPALLARLPGRARTAVERMSSLAPFPQTPARLVRPEFDCLAVANVDWAR